MTEAATRSERGWKIFVGLALLVVAVLAGWVLFAETEHAGTESAARADAGGDQGFVGFDESGAESDLRAARDRIAATQNAASPDADAGASSGARLTSMRGRIVRQKQPEPDAGDTGEAADAGGAELQDVVEWSDPDNQKMLGSRSWMATPSDEEAEAVDEALDRPQPQRYPIDLQERRLGVEIAKDIVKDCFEGLLERAPQAKGRVSVAFDLVADGTVARFENVELPANVHLEEPTYEKCITDELSAVSYRSAEQGTMHVEYPFLLGAADHR